MKYNYYIQVGSIPAVNIWDEFGIYVASTEGLTTMPDAKAKFSRSWPDEQGDDAFLPDIIRFKSKEIKITFEVVKSDKVDAIAAIQKFHDHIYAAGQLSYFDTYKQTGFRGYYDKSSVNEEKYRETQNRIQFDMNFIAPNGICWGFDNSGQYSIFVDVLMEYGDFYFSDGTSLMNMDSDFIKDLDEGFVIACPSAFGGIKIEERALKLFVDANERLFISSTNKAFIV